MSTTERIGKNMRFMILNRAVALLISFLVFPFIVSNTGQEIYGVYLTVMTVTGYFGLLDLGVMSALTKYVSEFKGKGNLIKVNEIINASFTFYTVIGAFAGVLLFLLSVYFPLLFKISSQNLEITKNLFFVAAISAIFIWPTTTFRGSIEGLNLWDIEAIVNIFVQLLNGLFAYVIFKSGYSIIHFFISSQVLTILGNTVFFIVSRKKIGLSFVFPYLNLDTFKHIFNFSIFIFLSALLNIFLFQIHNIIIGYFLSMSYVTIYAVAHNIQNYFRYINSTLGGPPWTVASEMEGRGNLEGQRKLLFKGTKYMTAIFIPMVLIVFFFSEPFIKYWMGPGFEESVLPAKIIILFWLFNGTLEMASGMLSAKGIVKKPLYIHIFISMINIIISVSLIKKIGINAVALGLTLSMIFGFPFILRLSLKKLKVTFYEYFKNTIKDNLKIYLFVSILSFLLINTFYPANIYLTLIEMCLIYTSALFLYYFVLLKEEERTDIKTISGVNILLKKAI